MGGRRLGPLSLSIAAGGFIALEAALRYGMIHGIGWRIAASAFEAGTIGGLADWFAVTALFREVPLPVIRRHTNIIVKNRARIVDGIADMVQNRWLSPEVVGEYLQRFSASRALAEYLADPGRREKVLLILRDLIHSLARSLDGPEMASFLDRVLKDQVRGLDLAEPLGRWMEQAISRRDHDPLWDALLHALERSMADPEVEELFRRFFRRAVEEYKRTGMHRRILLDLAAAVDLVNDREAARLLLDRLRAAVSEARGRPGHPFRERLDGMLLGFARSLSDGDPEPVSAVETLRSRLVDHADSLPFLSRLLSRFRETVVGQLDSPGSELSRMLDRFLVERLAEFGEDPEAQRKLDDWVRETAMEIVRKRHAAIGEMVRGSLGKLGDVELAAQIEEKVGRDLQYIRLNGAVVGGLAGAFLEGCRQLLLRGGF
ncbi:MAG: DUF445 domain-containing protein [Deltaproteobacteria bacterium]